eukprot:tig00021312_g20048.t1
MANASPPPIAAAPGPRRTGPGARASPTGAALLEDVPLPAPGSLVIPERARAGQAPQQQAGSVGIDFGTAYCRSATWDMGRIEIVSDRNRLRSQPNYVTVVPEGRVAGEEARAYAILYPQNTLYDAKRVLGRRFFDPPVQARLRTWNFFMTAQDGDKPVYAVPKGDQRIYFSPLEITAMMLMRQRELTEAYLNRPVRNAVIAVPAGFSTIQRQAIRDAGAVAGLSVIRLVEEPVAIALGHVFDRMGVESKGWSNPAVADEPLPRVSVTFVVVDIGASAVNASLQTFEDGVLHVRAVAGDSQLGGDDFTQRMVDFFVQQFKLQRGRDISADHYALRRLRAACERAKKALSSHAITSIELDSLVDGIDLYTTISRTAFEELCEDLFRRCLEPVSKVLRESGVDRAAVFEVVVAGGSTRIPRVQELLRALFDGKELTKTMHHEEAVAAGCALISAILSGDGKGEMDFGAPPEWRIHDVVRLSLGVELATGVMTKIIACNTKLPTQNTVTLSTHHDNQPTVLIQVFEGEGSGTGENVLLGRMELSGLPVVSRGVALFDLTFEVDMRGVVTVRAVDRNNGTRKEMIIGAPEVRVSKEDIRRFALEARGFHEEYERYRRTDPRATQDAVASLVWDLRTRTTRHYPKDDAFYVSEAANVLSRLRASIKQSLTRDGAHTRADAMWRNAAQVLNHVESYHLDMVSGEAPEAEYRKYLHTKLEEIRSVVPPVYIREAFPPMPDVHLEPMRPPTPPEPVGEDGYDPASPPPWAPAAAGARRRLDVGLPLVLEHETDVAAFVQRLLVSMQIGTDKVEMRLARVNQAQLFDRGVAKLENLVLTMHILGEGPNKEVLRSPKSKEAFGALLDRLQAYYFGKTTDIAALVEKKEKVTRKIEKARKIFG